MSKDLYLREMKDIRKELRTKETEAEKELWKHIRKMQLGYKFRRQVSIGYYVVDFYCKRVNLAIEVDGKIHNRKEIEDRDKFRQAVIEVNNVSFIRFTNEEVMNDIDNVLTTIKYKCDELAPPCGELACEARLRGYLEIC
jgi:very-short-patch-repair endonuclease